MRIFVLLYIAFIVTVLDNNDLRAQLAALSCNKNESTPTDSSVTTSTVLEPVIDVRPSPEPRYALLLYGLPRWVETGLVAENLRRDGLLDRPDVDVFAHMWTTDQPVTGDFLGVTNQTLIDPKAEEIVRTQFKPLKMRVEPLPKLGSLKQVDDERLHRVFSQLLAIEMAANLTVGLGLGPYRLVYVARYDVVCYSRPAEWRDLPLGVTYVSDQHPRFPDLWLLVDGKDVPQSLQFYSYLDENLARFASDVWEFSPESAKYIHVRRFMGVAGMYSPCDRVNVADRDRLLSGK